MLRLLDNFVLFKYLNYRNIAWFASYAYIHADDSVYIFLVILLRAIIHDQWLLVVPVLD